MDVRDLEVTKESVKNVFGLMIWLVSPLTVENGNRQDTPAVNNSFSSRSVTDYSVVCQSCNNSGEVQYMVEVISNPCCCIISG